MRRMDLVAAPGARGPGAYRGMPLFCDVTVVSPHTQTGAARPRAAREDGCILTRAVQQKRRTYADVERSGMARLYGRWTEDALTLVRELARLKAREAPALLRPTARQAWSARWWAILGVGIQRAVGEALLVGVGADLIPSTAQGDHPCLADLLGMGE